jgi:hypothetical protein
MAGLHSLAVVGDRMAIVIVEQAGRRSQDVVDLARTGQVFAALGCQFLAKPAAGLLVAC